MITSELVANTILRATGKTSTSVSGDIKWNKVLGIANLKIDDWMNEPEVDWNSLYDRAFSIGTVTNMDTFALDLDTIREISTTYGDPVRIYYPDGVGYVDYDVIPFDQLKQFPSGYYCAQIGANLVFNHTFTTADAQFGGTIYVPILLYADHLVNDGDEVPVDIPNWLVVACAAEYIRTDVTRQNQYTNLATEANLIMERMKDANDGQIGYVTSEWSPLSRTWL